MCKFISVKIQQCFPVWVVTNTAVSLNKRRRHLLKSRTILDNCQSYLIFEPSNFLPKWHGLDELKTSQKCWIVTTEVQLPVTLISLSVSLKGNYYYQNCPAQQFYGVLFVLKFVSLRIEQIHRTFSVKDFHWSYHYVVLYFAMKYSKCGKRYHVLFYFEWDFPNKSWCVIKDTVCLI